MMFSGEGYYVGSLDAYGKRVRRGRLLARGNGVWQIDDDSLRYRRFLTKQPIVIRRDAIIDIRQGGSWFAGRWVGRRRFTEIRWASEQGEITSGFVFGRTPKDTARVITALGR